MYILFFKPSCGISIMCPPNAFDFSAFIKFSLICPSEATPYLPSFCPTTQSCHNDEIFKMLIIIVHAVAYKLFTLL